MHFRSLIDIFTVSVTLILLRAHHHCTDRRNMPNTNDEEERCLQSKGGFLSIRGTLEQNAASEDEIMVGSVEGGGGGLETGPGGETQPAGGVFGVRRVFAEHETRG